MLEQTVGLHKRNGKLWHALNSLPVILLVATPILWFFRTFILINALPLLGSDVQIISVSVCIFGIVISAIVTSSRTREPNRSVFLKRWLLFGFLVTFTVFIYWFFSSIYLLFTISGLIGIFFGYGAPVLLGYFSSVTKDNNRSAISGATFLVIGFFYNLFASIDSIYQTLLILVTLLVIASISLRATTPQNTSISIQNSSWSRISADRTFLLYVLSTFMFMIGIFLLIPATNVLLPQTVSESIDLLGGIIIASAALVGGFIGDILGRKKLVMIGFFLAALSYGIFSVSTNNISIWISYKLVYATALGILYPMFLFTLWGDLSKKGSSEKYYTIGCLPFIISVALMYSAGTYLASFLQPTYLYSFVSLFLFAAILPIAYAKEILPSLDKVQELNEKLKVISNLTRHDINNKLTTVNGQAYLLKMDNIDNPEIVEHAKEIEQAVKDSVRIFEFAKIYENLGAEEPSYVNVEKAIDDAIALCPNWNFKILNECQNVSLLADSFLSELFYNFLDNTRKYGMVTKTGRFYYEPEKERAMRLIYEDDGVGISTDNKSKLFTEGFSTGGSKGYGLFLIKKMVDGYGWTIAEVGEPGKGVKFVICIPSNAVSIS